MRKLSGSAYSLIVVIVATIFFMIMSLELAHFGSKFLPLVIGSIVLILAVAALAREIKTTPRTTNSDASSKTSEKKNAREEANGYLRAGTWVVGLALAIYLIGFTIATFVVVGLYMKLRGTKWHVALITALIFTGAIYAMFNIWLKADLYSGEIFKWLSD